MGHVTVLVMVIPDVASRERRQVDGASQQRCCVFVCCFEPVSPALKLFLSCLASFYLHAFSRFAAPVSAGIYQNLRNRSEVPIFIRLMHLSAVRRIGQSSHFVTWSARDSVIEFAKNPCLIGLRCYLRIPPAQDAEPQPARAPDAAIRMVREPPAGDVRCGSCRSRDAPSALRARAIRCAARRPPTRAALAARAGARLHDARGRRFRGASQSRGPHRERLVRLLRREVPHLERATLERGSEDRSRRAAGVWQDARLSGSPHRRRHQVPVGAQPSSRARAARSGVRAVRQPRLPRTDCGR